MILRVSNGALTTRIARLVGRAMRVKEPAARDRCAFTLALTPAAAAKVEAIHSALAAESTFVREVNRLPEADRAALERVMGELHDRWSATPCPRSADASGLKQLAVPCAAAPAYARAGDKRRGEIMVAQLDVADDDLRAVTAEEIAHFQEHGWVKLRQFVSPGRAAGLLAMAKERMGEHGDRNAPPEAFSYFIRSPCAASTIRCCGR